jgi:hypothetical protein
LNFGKDTHFEKIPDADPATFVSIGDFYGKDKAHVFKETVVLRDADPATFQPPK